MWSPAVRLTATAAALVVLGVGCATRADDQPLGSVTASSLAVVTASTTPAPTPRGSAPAGPSSASTPSTASTPSSPATRAPSAGSVLVRTGEVAVALADGAILAVTADGGRTRTLGRVPIWPNGHVDAVDVAPDGGRVLVSVLDDSDEGGPPDSSGAPTNACRAAVYSVLRGRAVKRLASGADASMAPDGHRVAYLRYALDHGFCVRTHLVVRDLGSGAEEAVPLPGGSVLEGTPPEWPLTWSPDGTRVAFVSERGALVSRVDGREVTRVGGARPSGGERTLAPVFLADGTVAGMTGCCLGGEGRMVAFPSTGDPYVLFPLATPVRAIRRDRGGAGLWLTMEETSLWHWDGRHLRAVFAPALITSG